MEIVFQLWFKYLLSKAVVTRLRWMTTAMMVPIPISIASTSVSRPIVSIAIVSIIVIVLIVIVSVVRASVGTAAIKPIATYRTAVMTPFFSTPIAAYLVCVRIFVSWAYTHREHHSFDSKCFLNQQSIWIQRETEEFHRDRERRKLVAKFVPNNAKLCAFSNLIHSIFVCLSFGFCIFFGENESKNSFKPWSRAWNRTIMSSSATITSTIRIWTSWIYKKITKINRMNNMKTESSIPN